MKARKIKKINGEEKKSKERKQKRKEQRRRTSIPRLGLSTRREIIDGELDVLPLLDARLRFRFHKPVPRRGSLGVVADRRLLLLLLLLFLFLFVASLLLLLLLLLLLFRPRRRALLFLLRLLLLSTPRLRDPVFFFFVLFSFSDVVARTSV